MIVVAQDLVFVGLAGLGLFGFLGDLVQGGPHRVAGGGEALDEAGDLDFDGFVEPRRALG